VQNGGALKYSGGCYGYLLATVLTEVVPCLAHIEPPRLRRRRTRRRRCHRAERRRVPATATAIAPPSNPVIDCRGLGDCKHNQSLTRCQWQRSAVQPVSPRSERRRRQTGHKVGKQQRYTLSKATLREVVSQCQCCVYVCRQANLCSAGTTTSLNQCHGKARHFRIPIN
jgi:hypothetical protein